MHGDDPCSASSPISSVSIMLHSTASMRSDAETIQTKTNSINLIISDQPSRSFSIHEQIPTMTVNSSNGSQTMHTTIDQGLSVTITITNNKLPSMINKNYRLILIPIIEHTTHAIDPAMQSDDDGTTRTAETRFRTDLTFLVLSSLEDVTSLSVSTHDEPSSSINLISERDNHSQHSTLSYQTDMQINNRERHVQQQLLQYEATLQQQHDDPSAVSLSTIFSRSSSLDTLSELRRLSLTKHDTDDDELFDSPRKRIDQRSTIPRRLPPHRPAPIRHDLEPFTHTRRSLREISVSNSHYFRTPQHTLSNKPTQRISHKVSSLSNIRPMGSSLNNDRRQPAPFHSLSNRTRPTTHARSTSVEQRTTKAATTRSKFLRLFRLML